MTLRPDDNFLIMTENVWICVVLSSLLFSCVTDQSTIIENTEAHKNHELAPFYHGVASGDPDHNSVVIWTRVTPTRRDQKINVHWEMSEDEGFSEIVQQGTFQTDSQRDYTVKVLVESLDPGRFYFYRFSTSGQRSIIGRTRTAPDEAQELRFAVASCSNYEWGYFNAYRAISEELDLHAVIHLGDYIYEYGIGRYGDTTIGRINIPHHEIVSLLDYRDRYALYRTDPDLQALHQYHPVIAVWDDHEITNNAYRDGAENHQPEEGSYLERKEVARKVYYEWMPIRESPKHYRKFSFGDLADLIMLDERLEGRSEQVEDADDPRREDPQQSILGAEQMEWLEEQLIESSAKWKLIGNQVIFSHLDLARPNFHFNMDAWDGYPGDQRKVASIIRDNQVSNVVFLTGDTHASWAFEVTLDPRGSYMQEGGFAVEFGATSVNSANADEQNPVDSVIVAEKRVLDPKINPHLKYSNMRDHGYCLVTVTAEELKADFIYVKTVRKPSREVFIAQSFLVESESNALQPVH